MGYDSQQRVEATPLQSTSKVFATLQNMTKDPIIEDTRYLCHRTWKNLADIQTEALCLQARIHSAIRCYT